MLRLGKERKEISVVADQFGAPTYTADLAPLLCDMVMTDKYGTYHACNSGCCSWAEFAQEIFRAARMDIKVIPIRTEEYLAKAKRPRNSRLYVNIREFTSCQLEGWKDAVSAYLIHAKGNQV